MKLILSNSCWTLMRQDIPVVPEEGELGAMELNESLTLPGEKRVHCQLGVWGCISNITNPKWLCVPDQFWNWQVHDQNGSSSSMDTVESESNHVPTSLVKLGMLIILLWNSDQYNGHCNSSRYIIDQSLPELLVATSVVGANAGHMLDTCWTHTPHSSSFWCKPALP